MSLFSDFVKPIVVLGGICLVTSTLLAVTNSATAPIIEANAIKTANAARAELLPSADKFTLQENLVTADVPAVYKADNDTGYVMTAQAKGYGGQVPVMLAFDKDGKIAAVKFLDNDETPGLGQKIKNPAFAQQFAGMESKNIALSDIDAISGATISSAASVTAINSAIALYNTEVKGEEVIVLTPEEVRAKVLPNGGEITPMASVPAGAFEAYQGANGGTILYVEGKGFYKKPLIAAVGFDDAGAITGVWLDTTQETNGVGTQVGTDAKFSEQFIGKTSAKSYDVVAGATMSSDAAAATVQMAIDAYNASKGA
ncbi:MAG: FMN-binding protein [Ruthenibacterium sp.]